MHARVLGIQRFTLSHCHRRMDPFVAQLQHLVHGKRREDMSFDYAIQCRNCAGALPHKQREKSDKATDPLKSVFMRAPKKGGDVGEPLTGMEAKAQEEGAKLARKLAKKQGGAFVPKRNVRTANNFRRQ